MIIEKNLGSAKTLEEARKIAVDQACVKYGISAADLDITIEQEPVNKLLSKKNAIVSATVKKEKIEELNRIQEEKEHLEKKRREVEEATRHEEERKRKEEEERILAEQKKTAEEAREKMLEKVKLSRLNLFKDEITLPRFILDNLIIFYAVFDNSPFMNDVTIQTIVEDWLRFEELYIENGYLSLDVLRDNETEIYNILAKFFNVDVYGERQIAVLNLENQVHMLLHPKKFSNAGEEIPLPDTYNDCKAILQQTYDLKMTYSILFSDDEISYANYMNFARVYLDFLIQLVNVNYFVECKERVMMRRAYFCPTKIRKHLHRLYKPEN